MRNSAIPTLVKPLLFLLFLSLSACESKQESAQSFLQSGLEHYASGEYEKARVQLLNALQRDGRLPKAYYHLGLIAEREGRVAIVYEMMSKCLKLDPAHLPARKTIAQLMVLGKKFDKALQMAEEILEIDQNDFEGYQIKAAALIGSKKYKAAIEALDVAQGIQPKEASLIGLRAIVERERGNIDQAISYLNEAVEKSDSPKQYIILRSKIHRDVQRVDALIEDLKALVQLVPDESQYVYALAKIYVNIKRYSDAEDVLHTLVERQPINFEAKQLWVDAIYLTNPRRAEALLEELMRKYPAESALKFYQVRLLLKEGQSDLAKMKLRKMAEIRDHKQSHLKAKALIAEIFLNEGDRDRALALIYETLGEDNQHEESLLVKAKYDLDNLDYELAISSIHTVLRNNPDSETALVLLGKVHVDGGSVLLADDSYRQALKVNPGNADAAMPVVRRLIETQDLERAENIIGRVLDSSPNDAKLLMFFIQIKLLQKDWVGAKLSTDRLAKLDKTAAYSQFLYGRIAQGEKNCVAATAYYQKALSINASIVPAIEGVIECHPSNQQFLYDFLTNYKNENPRLVYGYSALAQLYQLDGEFQRAAEELRLAIDVKPDWLKGYANLAGLKNDMGDTQSAIEIFRKGIAAIPENDYLKVLLAAYLESLSREEEAIQLYEEVVESHPDNLVALNNYIVLLLDKHPSPANYSRALELAVRFKENDNAIFLDTYGWALAKNELLQPAESVLRTAAEKAQGLVDIQYHFAVVLRKLDRIEEARVVFKRAQKLTGDRPLLAKEIALALFEIESERDAQPQ